ncbi:MAG: acyclic terpene utilization AtuA family protein [Longimicrobiales bacterium]
MSSTIRIASGQGFWGDRLDAPVEQVRRGPIDYLMLDYLAEVTMSILQKQRSRDPAQGYARDFVPLMGQILKDCVEKHIRVVANAGGVNPDACRDGVLAEARKAGLAGQVKVGVVSGDDILHRLEELVERGHELRNMDDGRPLSEVLGRVQSANAYIGARPIVEALDRGATVVITGRSTDTALTYGPMIHAFGWARDDWDRLACGVVAGHINECGAQASGGNSLVEWERVAELGLADAGFPIIEASSDGSFAVTKHDGTGGRITPAVLKEQIVYEMGDPREYITPDVIADFTTIQLEQQGPDRVRVFGIKGRPNTDQLKVSISFDAGWKAVGTLVYAWPDAVEKARVADRVLRQRFDRLGLAFDEVRTEFVGWNATHGHLAGPPPDDLPEVELRIAVRGQDRNAVEAFTREIAPLVLTGPPTVTGFAGGRPRVQEVVAYWPALIDRAEIEPNLRVEVTEA